MLALVDKSFAALDLSSCSHIKPSTLVSALDRTRMLQKLNVSGCKLTNCFVYSLPSSVPHLLVLRLCGAHVSGVDSLAWSQLIPSARVSRTPDSWEEDMDSGQRRCASASLSGWHGGRCILFDAHACPPCLCMFLVRTTSTRWCK